MRYISVDILLWDLSYWTWTLIMLLSLDGSKPFSEPEKTVPTFQGKRLSIIALVILRRFRALMRKYWMSLYVLEMKYKPGFRNSLASNWAITVFFVRSLEQIDCPCCTGRLEGIGRRKRGCIDSLGEKIILNIRRLRCIECERIHHGFLSVHILIQ